MRGGKGEGTRWVVLLGLGVGGKRGEEGTRWAGCCEGGAAKGLGAVCSSRGVAQVAVGVRLCLPLHHKQETWCGVAADRV